VPDYRLGGQNVRIVSKLLVAATTAAAVTAMMATPALADPPTGVTPKPGDVVGVGSDTIQNVFDQFSHDYNATHSTGKLYSWDALNPKTGAMGDPIQLKSGSTACKIPRPDGSSAGITALENTGKTSTHPCIDFARSSRARATTDPTTISFIDLAGDAVTVATQPGSHAPANLLTTAVLTGIYNCTITKWNQIPGNSGGSTATISAFAPQNGSGTRAFFLGALGLTNPGPCVSTSATRAGAAGAGDNTLQENEGVAPILNKNKANVIFPFSVGKWIAEKFHSASCGTTAQCFADPTNCHPTGSQNLFGCNTHGTMVLNKINGTAPTKGTGTSTVINPGFTATFTRILFEVVNANQGTIPASLAKYFGPTGFTCTNATAKTDLKHYGFLVLPNGTGPGHCGFAQ
jgi:ABC-type phosphate transport system substrate-binding protein